MLDVLEPDSYLPGNIAYTLLLSGSVVDWRQVETWTTSERALAFDWAHRAWLRASVTGSRVALRPKPTFVIAAENAYKEAAASNWAKPLTPA